jgi:hypothetical protein
MNKRIEELSLQCIRYKLVAEGARSDFDYKKFAELIVGECMSIAQEYDGAKLGGPGLIIAMRIEQHFGVEE